MRLIDADNLKIPNDAPYKASVKRVVAMQPTVDAVEVVRCKDCVSFNDRHHTCSSLYLSGQTIVNGYCFNGQRKKV